MATFQIPHQNISVEVPDEGQIFRGVTGNGQDSAFVRYGGTLYQVPKTQFTGDFGSLPEINPGSEGLNYLTKGGKNTVMGDVSAFQRALSGTPTQGEVITRAINPANPQGTVVTSSTGGQLSTSPSTAEQAAKFSTTPEALKGVQTTQTPTGTFEGGKFTPGAQAPAPQPVPGQEVAAPALDVDTFNDGNGIYRTNPDGTATLISGSGPQTLSRPVSPPAASITPGSVSTHTVQEGDTLSVIAQRYGVPINQITGYRSGNPNLIFPGEVLSINKAPVVSTPTAPGSTPGGPQAPVSAPTAPGTSAPVPTTGGNSFDELFAQYGLSTKNDIEDIVKSISKLYGLDSINKQMEDLDNEHAEAVASVGDNPWISESLRSREITKLADTYEQKKNALVNRLRLNQDVIGKSIDMYYKERSFQQENLFKALDLRAKEMELASKVEARNVKEVRGGLYDLDTGSWIVDPEVKVPPGDVLTLEDRLRIAGQLRDDARLDPDIKIFPEARQAYETIALQARRKDAVGDLTLLRLYAKLTDPTSSVREEEFESMESAQGALARRGIRLTKGQITGERLLDSARQQFVSAAKQIYESRERNYNIAIDRIQQNALDIGVDPNKIISKQGAVIPDIDPGTEANSVDFGVSQPLTTNVGGFLGGVFNWLFAP